MAAGAERDEPRWPALFRRSREPIFVLNRRRQLIFANPAWEALTGVSIAKARSLVCTRRITGHVLADLGRTLTPPSETLKGQTTQVRRPFPGTATGPPWWDIDFLPLMGEDGVTAMVGRIRRAEPAPVAPRATMPAAWAELRARTARTFTFASWESNLPEMRRAVSQARLAAETGCRAALVGPPGVGKETLARTIQANSPRRELSCIALDCTRLPAEAIRAVLFGPLGLKQSDWLGAVYLHEPAKLPLDLQAEIAAALGDRPQVLAGFAEEPRLTLANGTLHGDLYAALAMLVITLPSLRERIEELPRHVDAMSQHAAEVLGRSPRGVTAEALEVLKGHAWTGNFDELASVVFVAHRREDTAPMDVADLPLPMRQGVATALSAIDPLPTLDQLLERVEKRMIALALKRAKGNKSKAAELLGVWRPRLLRRMESLGIADPGGEP